MDLENLARLSGFTVVRQRLCGYFPWRLCGVGTLINRVLPVIPLLRLYSLACVVALRPVMAQLPAGISCVIPARNERDNIENALQRFPKLDYIKRTEFVE